VRIGARWHQHVLIVIGGDHVVQDMVAVQGHFLRCAIAYGGREVVLDYTVGSR
jgi:hypothetical protein